MSKKITHEMYVEELKNVNPNIEVLEKYKGRQQKIKHRCKKDGFIWEARPDNILHGKGCPECKRIKAKKENLKTTEQYIQELKDKRPDILLVDEYKGANVKVKHKCLKHDYVWDVAPVNILSGSGCPKCKSEAITNKRTKTTEQYKKELLENNIQVVPLEDYVSAKTKIKHLCLKHNVEWCSTPSNVLNGTGCPQCRIEKTRNKRAKTQEEYAKELKEVNPDIEVVGTYVNAGTKIMHHCLKHNVYWETSPASALQGCGCEKCRSERLREANLTDYNDFMQLLTLFFPDYELVGKFKGISEKTTFHCLIHDVYWDTYPYNIINGMGCEECRKEKLASALSKSQEEYISELKTINPMIEVLGTYKNVNTKILHRCKKHNYEWLTTPASMLKGCGCPECMKERIAEKNVKGHDEYIADVTKINPDIEVIGTYEGVDVPILHRCKRDGHEWLATPHSILCGYGCPVCNETNGERGIRQFLEENNISYIMQKRFDDCRDSKPLPFDFYLPEYNYLIEYDGEQHYFPINFSGQGEQWANKHFEITKRHDQIKDDYCKNNNIPLLRIPYFKNIETELTNFLFT